MSDKTDVYAFQNGVANEAECYITGHEHKARVVHVLVPERTSTRSVFQLAEDKQMVCTGVNALKYDGFDYELTFNHMSRTEFGDS